MNSQSFPGSFRILFLMQHKASLLTNTTFNLCLILITCGLPGAVALPGVYADFQPQGQLLLPYYQEPLGGPSEYTVASKQGITPASLLL